MNTKSGIGEVNAQLSNYKEHGDMDYETTNGRATVLGERDDALDGRAAALDGRAAALDGRAAALDERAAALDERDDALERDGDKMARPPFGCSPACNRVRTNGLNDRDLLTIKNVFKFLSGSTENVTVHIETRADGIAVDVRSFASVEPQPLIRHPQPSSKNSDGNAVAKEKVQNGDGVKDRIWGLIGKIHIVVQTVSNSIKIWEICQAVSLIGLGMFGGS